MTNTNPQKCQQFREEEVGTDLFEINTFYKDYIDRKIDIEYYDVRGIIANGAD